MELTTSKIENLITQISELSTIEKEKIFDYFEDEKREYYFNSIIKDANDLERDFKENKVKSEKVDDFLNRLIDIGTHDEVYL